MTDELPLQITNKLITVVDLEAFAKDYESPMTFAELTEKYGISTYQLRRVGNKYGLKRPKGRRSRCIQ